MKPLTGAQLASPKIRNLLQIQPRTGTPIWNAKRCLRLSVHQADLDEVFDVMRWRASQILPYSGGARDQPRRFWAVDALLGHWVEKWRSADDGKQAKGGRWQDRNKPTRASVITEMKGARSQYWRKERERRQREP